MNKDCHLKRRVTLFAIVFNTIMIGSVHAAVLYSFENSLDGWSNVDTSTTANGPKQFASYSKAYFTANYNNAEGARLTPSDGDYLLVCDPFGTSASTIRDNAHETLVIRSPEFYLHTSGSISADIYG